MKLKRRLFIVVNVDWFFLSHRLPIALEAQKRGFDVTILAIEEEDKGEEIRSHGFKFIALPSSRGGRNVFSEFGFLFFLYKLYRKEKPDIVHHVAIKPVLYGSIASRICSVPIVVNAISGLGSTFIDINVFSPFYHLVRLLYRISLSNNKVKVIVQNIDDLKVILSLKAVSESKIFLIEGSGVDMNALTYSVENNTKPIRIVLLSRMLWDKGIGELVRAAEKLKLEFKDSVEVVLGGKVDDQNSTFIPESQLLKWNSEGNVNWIGFESDVESLLRNSHISVLPSYREGLPKALIEAMAIGRPVVTTDVPGCRSVVVDEVTGYLVPSKDYLALYHALRKLVISRDLRIRMGLAGRKLAEKKFSLNMVINKTLKLYESGS